MKYLKLGLLLLTLSVVSNSWSQDILNTISKTETERKIGRAHV